MTTTRRGDDPFAAMLPKGRAAGSRRPAVDVPSAEAAPAAVERPQPRTSTGSHAVPAPRVGAQTANVAASPSTMSETGPTSPVDAASGLDAGPAPTVMDQPSGPVEVAAPTATTDGGVNASDTDASDTDASDADSGDTDTATVHSRPPATPRSRRRPAPKSSAHSETDEPTAGDSWPGVVDSDGHAQFAGSDEEPTTHRSTRPWRRRHQPDTSPKPGALRRTARDEKQDNTDAVAFSAALGGKRRMQKAVQVALAVILLVVVAAGVSAIVRPAPRVLSSAAITTIAQDAVAGTGFPAQAAETFAVQFAQTYYTWNGADRDARLARTADLDSYLPASVDDGWDGQGVQTIARGPFIARDTRSADRNNGTVSLALQTDSGAWLYPQVMIWADDTGSLTVAATPVLGPAPARASFPGNSASVTGDVDTAAARAVQPVLTGFFTAWAASDSNALDRYLTQDAAVPARQGLDGAVDFGAISDVVVSAENNSDGSRSASATVQWVYGDPAQPTSSTTSQTYLLTLVQNSGQWSLRDIAAGTVGAGSG